MKKNTKQRFAMSRRRRNTIFVMSLLFFISLILLDRLNLAPLFKSEQASTQAPLELSDHDIKTYHSKSFKVIRVVDGDTLDIDHPDPPKNFTRIRLWGVDTPETKKPGQPVMHFGPQASNFTKEKTLNQTVTIYLDLNRSTRGYFGRLLAYVKLPDSTFLNEQLIVNGLAYADLRFNHDYLQKYKNLQRIAQKNNKGLWKDVTRSQLPDWLQQRDKSLLNKK